jgi:hypothetical protein
MSVIPHVSSELPKADNSSEPARFPRCHLSNKSPVLSIVQAVLPDGSARSINEKIDLNIWRALGTRVRVAGEPVTIEF